MSRYSVGRSIAMGIMTRDKRRRTYRKIQNEAAERPESTQVETPYGKIWMSPIEYELYEAMLKQGLSPEPQLCIKGYFVDFAFPDIKLAVEADGKAYHEGERRERDRDRDHVLRSAGWTMKRFYGTTIYSEPENCAFEIRRVVESRRGNAGGNSTHRDEEEPTASASPFHKIAQLFARNK